YLINHLASSYYIDIAITSLYMLSLHDALPISLYPQLAFPAKEEESRTPADEILLLEEDEESWKEKEGTQTGRELEASMTALRIRSEEHTSELQSRFDLVCRLLLEKKKKN